MRKSKGPSGSVQKSRGKEITRPSLSEAGRSHLKTKGSRRQGEKVKERLESAGRSES